MVDIRRIILVGSALAATTALPVRAYNDTVTHPRLSVISTEKSALYTDAGLMFRLGLRPAPQQSFSYRQRVGKTLLNTTVTYSLEELIGEGAFNEDLESKPLNHFFDPQFGIPLVVFKPLGVPSWEWITEPTPLPGQDFSLRDARDYLARGLTFNEGSPTASEAQRFGSMGNMFLSLGAAMHHMQDMHQPQHVRNDDHLDEHPYLVGLYKPSRYELFTRDNRASIDGIAQAGSPVFPGSLDFRVSRDFWFNGTGTASADYVGTNYVSQGANFTIVNGVANVGGHPLPRPGPFQDVSVEALFADASLPVPPHLGALCGIPAVNCNMTMYAAGPSARATTLSIFDQDLVKNGQRLTWPAGNYLPSFQSQRLFALNRFNFTDAHRTLIGRAVGFSAGLVNHFFRGKIDVSPPEKGAYAVVDNSAGQGFYTVRATLKNTTPNEALKPGQVTAIARFHRNECYKADLSGEWQETDEGVLIAPTCDAVGTYRSDVEHIRVSSEQSLSLGIGEQKELTFTFSDPVPLDATDLVLQVLFRGTVGTEPEAIAVGAVDISEPTWVAVMNATDVFEIPAGATNKFFYFGEIIKNIRQAPYSIVDRNGNGDYDPPPDVEVRGGDIRYAIAIDGEKVGDVDALPAGRFFRLAVLAKPTGFNMDLTATGQDFFLTERHSFPAKQAQVDYSRNAYIVSPVDKLRNQTLQYDSVTFWKYYPVSTLGTDDMPASMHAEAATPVEVTPTPQP